MRYAFGSFILDIDRMELNDGDDRIALEPKSFDLLKFLVENHFRVVSKDEIFDHVWPGVFVSESSISSTIKQIRHALGDDGDAQKVIRTVRGKGFRFVADVAPVEEPSRVAAAPKVPDTQTRPLSHGAGQPGIAVLRFLPLNASETTSTLSRAVAAEIISGLSRMSWLNVIARGSSFRFDPASFDPSEIAAQLGVGYVMSGDIEIRASSVKIQIEIQSARENSVVWSDGFEADLSEIELLRAQIVAAVISALELTIPQFEAQWTRVLSPDQFDAWSHFHLGLTQAFRFTQGGNKTAAEHFRSALDLDPGFARGHAGMSFVHWQNAFMQMNTSRAALLEEARQEATRALELNPVDPLGNLSMARALWLSKESDASIQWLNRGLELNPNYALCHYTKGMVQNMRGDYEGALDATQKARLLSPLDPLYYGMLANQMLSEIALDNLEGAMELAEQSVHSPGAYYYSILWASIAAELGGQTAKAMRWRDRALAQWPDASIDAMLQTFLLQDRKLIQTVRGSLTRLGLS